MAQMPSENVMLDNLYRKHPCKQCSHLTDRHNKTNPLCKFDIICAQYTQVVLKNSKRFFNSAHFCEAK